MIQFYYHYEREFDKAKLVVTKDEIVQEKLVDKIICAVSTETKKADTHPRFVVSGMCKHWYFVNTDNFITAYIS